MMDVENIVRPLVSKSSPTRKEDEMTSQAINIANQMKSMSDLEIDYLWDFLRKRRSESLLKSIDMKLEESMNSDSLTEEEIAVRLKKLGIA
jgi:hypothetical protein